MAEMIYSKVMHLVTPKQYQIIQEVNNENEGDFFLDEGEPADEKIRRFNNNYLEKKAESKFKEDRSWEKLGERVTPMLQSQNQSQSQPQPQPQQGKVNDVAVVDSIVSEMIPSYKNKAKQLLLRLVKEDAISLNEKSLFINGLPLENNVFDIVNELVRPKQSLNVNIDELLRFILQKNIPKSLIYNKSAQAKLNSLFKDDDDSILATSSTPLNKTKDSGGKRLLYKDLSFSSSASSPSLTPAKKKKKKKKVALKNQDGKGGKWLKF